MRRIESPFGLRSPFGVSPFAAYAAGGYLPEYIADFQNETYAVDGAGSTFSDAVTATGTSLKTMVDSDGNLKWAPHNLLTYSEDVTKSSWNADGQTKADQGDGVMRFTRASGSGTFYPRNTSYTLVAGVQYTLTVEVRSFGTDPTSTKLAAYDGSWQVGSAITLADDFVEYSLTFTAASASAVGVGLQINGASGEGVEIRYPHLYRSDLGGMVNNPDRGDSYVPTTSSAVYLPRRGHHVYNGSSWVNEGLLLESEARTQLHTHSEDFTDASWLTQGGSWGAQDAERFQLFTLDTALSEHRLYDDKADLTDGSDYTLHAEFEYVDYAWAFLAIYDGVSTYRAWFNLQTGAKGTVDIGLTAHIIESAAGVYHCSISLTAGVSAGTPNVQLGLAESDGQSGSWTAAGQRVKVRNYQFEAGSTPSSYIPTSGSTVTRSAETLTAAAADLPWPSPVVIGEELVTNGTFDTDSDWTYVSGWSITGGKLEGVATGGVVEGITQVLSTVSGSVYQIDLDVDAVDGNDCILNIGSSLGSTTLATSGVKTYVFKAAANNETLQVRFSGASTAGDTVTIDNISVKEINPLSVSIAMDGLMTYADTGATEATIIKWDAGSGNNIYQYLMTFGASTGFIRFAQSASGAGDQVDNESAGPAQYSPGVNVPFSIASRHGSTFINGAVDGTALTEDTTPTALPDLSATDMDIGHTFMGTIKTLRVWADDIGDTGIAEASS